MLRLKKLVLLILYLCEGKKNKKKSFEMLHNVLRLAEVPHSRNFGFEQELSCGILANRCYAYVPTCLAGISFGTRIEIFN